ncbi:MAG: hypothetical protein Q8R76_05010 [Candidatus Omnitrophota bacterium]|nr:hypothetical protein [Candidatus Omnitrophota bacterium]
MSTPVKYYFLETCSPRFTERDAKVISLTPQVSYELGRRGIPYRILEDFYSERDLRSGEDEYFTDQLNWFKRFDAFLGEHIAWSSSDRCALARTHYDHLKYFVDTIIIQSYILSKVIASIAPENPSIEYIKASYLSERKQTMEQFRYGEQSTLFAELMPYVCKKFPNVKFTVTCEEVTPSDKASTTPGTVPGWFEAGMQYVKERVRAVYYPLKYRSSSSGGSPANNLRCLFIHTGSRHLDPVIRQLIGAGAVVYGLNGDAAYRLDCIRPGPNDKINAAQQDELSGDLKRQCEAASRELFGGEAEIVRWIENRCGLQLRDFLRPYLTAFVKDALSETLKLANAFKHFYEERNITHVFSHTGSDKHSRAGILGAKMVEGTMSVGIQHGCEIFEDKVWDIRDIDTFDHYLATDDYSQEKFRKSLEFDYVGHHRIEQSSHYLQSIKARHAALPRRRGSARKCFLYLPSKLSVHRRCFNSMVYPVLWYYEFQKNLLDFMGSQAAEYDFIYKQAPARNPYAKESVIRYLHDRQFSNIRVETAPPVEFFNTVDGVIMDRATTAFFEAAVCNVPTLVIYPSFMGEIINEMTSAENRRCTASFSSWEEAFRNIAEFIREPSRRHTPKLSLTKDSVVDAVAKMSANILGSSV